LKAILIVWVTDLRISETGRFLAQLTQSVSQLPPDMVCNQHWPRPESARSLGRCHRLAESSSIRSQNLRVEGVYLGWHGTQYLPVISRTNEIDPQLQADFGAQLTDPKWNKSKVTGIYRIVEQLSLSPPLIRIVHWWSLFLAKTYSRIASRIRE
jgi:hypothetical protein